MKILITGGAGYIGSTIASALEDAGHTPVILDSLITGRAEFTRGRAFYHGDIADVALLQRIFREHPDIYATIHCAALIVVPDSTARPYEYYTENVSKSLVLFKTLRDLGCPRVVFSSSASLYDLVPGFMVTEEAPLKPGSPYARTKYMMEMILRDFCAAYGMQGIALRYFNPIGADPQLRSGLPLKEPSLVVGRMVMVAQGLLPEFLITGTDYPTRDGTGVRDYIHVWDLAQAHVAAVLDFDGAFARAGNPPDNYLVINLGTGVRESIHVWDLAQAHVAAVLDFDGAFARAGNPPDNYLVINLGTGKGVTVREILTAFEKVYGQQINKREAPRRPGDAAGAYANADTAKRLLGWETHLSIEDGIRDALRWGDKRKEVLGY